MIIAVYGGVLGGTMYTLSYAMKKGLEIRALEVNGFQFEDKTAG